MEGLIQKARVRRETPAGWNQTRSWNTLARNYLEKAFGRNSPNVGAVTGIGAWDALLEESEGASEQRRLVSQSRSFSWRPLRNCFKRKLKNSAKGGRSLARRSWPLLQKAIGSFSFMVMPRRRCRRSPASSNTSIRK